VSVFLGRTAHLRRFSSKDISPTVPWLKSLESTLQSPVPETGSSVKSCDNGLHISPYPTDLDAIVVLAGGQTSHGSGLPPWVERRLETSLGFQNLQSKQCPILCLGN
jgi:hypothetical protein